MNIILLHGDNTEGSYKRLLAFIDEARKRNWQIVKIDRSTKDDLSFLIRKESLFNEDRIYIVYGLGNLNKKDLLWLKKDSTDVSGTLIIYEKATATANKLKHLPKGFKDEKYELPKMIFKFLDSFYPGNKRKCIRLFHQVIKNNPVEFVFILLANHIKDLYWVSIEPSKIPYPSWRVARLENQAGHFDTFQLKEVIKQLAKIDIKVKTSNTTLTYSLDLLIMRELE